MQVFFITILAIVKKICDNYKMGMKLIDKVFKETGLSSYKLSKLLWTHGVDISPQGIAQYKEARSMRLDVLCGLKKVSGLTWDEIGDLLESEFMPKKK